MEQLTAKQIKILIGRAGTAELIVIRQLVLPGATKLNATEVAMLQHCCALREDILWFDSLPYEPIIKPTFYRHHWRLLEGFVECYDKDCPFPDAKNGPTPTRARESAENGENETIVIKVFR